MPKGARSFGVLGIMIIWVTLEIKGWLKMEPPTQLLLQKICQTYEDF